MNPTASSAQRHEIDIEGLARLEARFIAPEIYNRKDVAARQANLANLVADEIIPRLLQLHGKIPGLDPEAPLSAAKIIPESGNIRTLADIVIGSDLEAAATYVATLRNQGLTLESLFLDLLEPTARYLGEMWDRDECDFVDVTLGVGRLQKLIAVFTQTYTLPEIDTRRKVLMASPDGDQHSFGLKMVERFMSAAGWDVSAHPAASRDEIADAAGREWFAVAGLTVATDRQLQDLKGTIVRVRDRSLNPAIGIMVGGPVFTACPALAAEVGADATAANAPAAVLAAQRLFDLGALSGWASPVAPGDALPERSVS